MLGSFSGDVYTTDIKCWVVSLVTYTPQDIKCWVVSLVTYTPQDIKCWVVSLVTFTPQTLNAAKFPVTYTPN